MSLKIQRHKSEWCKTFFEEYILNSVIRQRNITRQVIGAETDLFGVTESLLIVI